MSMKTKDTNIRISGEAYEYLKRIKDKTKVPIKYIVDDLIARMKPK